MIANQLDNLLRTVASSLNYPVIALLLLLMAATIVALGSLIVEIFTERSRLKVKLPELVDKLRERSVSTEECIAESGLLKRQKRALIELTRHQNITSDMRQALAERIIEEEQARFERIVSITDIFAKIGPMLGLLGTLIPLGPGLIALGQGDTLTLSSSLLTAFDTTIAGLVSAAVAMIISTVRKGWYSNYMSILETLAECVLEVEKRDEE